jgi:hypothetical protein
MLPKAGPGLGVGEGDGVTTGFAGNGEGATGDAVGAAAKRENTSACAINSKNLLDLI